MRHITNPTAFSGTPRDFSANTRRMDSDIFTAPVYGEGAVPVASLAGIVKSVGIGHPNNKYIYLIEEGRSSHAQAKTRRCFLGLRPDPTAGGWLGKNRWCGRNLSQRAH